MYHVSAQGVDERMINVHYYYVLLHLLICTVLRAHIIAVEALYKINYCYYYPNLLRTVSAAGGRCRKAALGV